MKVVELAKTEIEALELAKNKLETENVIYNIEEVVEGKIFKSKMIKVTAESYEDLLEESTQYLKQSKGALLLFSSSSYTRGRALYSTYSSSKSAIVNLMQALSEELQEDNIRINVINPERTKTPMRTKAFGIEPDDTLLMPEKVAQASLKVLLSDLTGQVIDVRR